MLRSINPFDQSFIAEYPEHDEKTIAKKLNAAAKTFKSWKTESFSKRAALMKNAGEILRKNKEQHARIISAEMGKALTESRGEVEKCAGACDFYAEHAEQFL